MTGVAGTVWAAFQSIPKTGRVLAHVPGWDARIYAIVGGDGGVRYVGKTVSTLEDRLAGHRGNPTNRHMRRLFAIDPAVRIELLTFAPYSAVDSMEIEWIARFRTSKFYLLNVDPGGRFRNPNGRPRKSQKRYAKMVRRQMRSEVA